MTDPYADIARFYDCEHGDFGDDVDFYLEAVQHGPVLEVGVGTGRIMLSLVQRGLQVWGVDPSPAMLQRAAERLSEYAGAHLVEGRIENADIGARFATAIVPLNTLWHMESNDDQLLALRTVRRLLQPDGMLIVDVSNPLTLADRGATGEVRERFRGLCDGESLTIRSAAWDEEAEQTLTLVLDYETVGPKDSVLRRSTRLRLRYLYRAEMELLLRLAGFRIRAIYGDYDLTPFGADSRQIVVVTAPAADAGDAGDA